LKLVYETIVQTKNKFDMNTIDRFVDSGEIMLAKIGGNTYSLLY